MRLIDADKLRHDAEWCRETTEAFQVLIDDQPTVCGGWIPVTDRLPQDDEDVLVWVDGTHRDMAYRDEGVWYDEEHNHLKNITHWMPLPEPPKEDI